MSEALRQQAHDRWVRLVTGHHKGEPLPLDEACACFGLEEDPTLEVDAVLEELDALARGLWLPPDEPLERRLARLHHHLYEVHGFAGDDDTYDDPQNSLLHRVLDRRRGLPILLSVVAIEVGRRVGLPLDGIGYPGHFLVAPAGAEPRFFVDPFRRGAILNEEPLRTALLARGVARRDQDRWLAPLSSHAILVRMAHNLRGSYEQRERSDDVARVERKLDLLAG